ncbi:MAG: PQQ-dependent sugar dehydrogenase [Candidatus Daviesbacteria bacterium]|nr:PQQ-dependent sugar dehydrogenase [Candidatus Daviesbacteria bacterium]
MGKIILIIILLLAAAIGLTIYKSTNRSSPPTTPNQTETKPLVSPSAQNIQNTPKLQIVATGLEVPWAIVFLPDKSILLTERKGTVRLIDTAGKLTSNPIAKISVKQTGESGLHGIAVHPNFDQNKYVYIYYTYSESGGNTFNRVSRFIFSQDILIDEKIIVDQIPGATFHDGGRIKFGPDNYLYITTGDAQNPSLSQNRNSLAGKILRVTDEGDPAPGNPIGTRIFSWGHRNPQGIAWDSQGQLWETEHGNNATDELNLIEPGQNYGWPQISGDQTEVEMISPKLQSGSSTWAPAGAAIYDNFIFFAGLRGQALFQVNLETLELKQYFKGEFGRIREVVLGPDNLLYISTSNRDGRGNPQPDDDKIIKIDPNQL